VVRPAVVYGCETWVLTKKSEEAWERKMLRKIFRGGKNCGRRMEKKNKERDKRAI
jgi:hypothetical protein